MKFLLVFTGINGFLAVLMGAASAHWLSAMMEASDLERIEKAATYQMYHTLGLLVLAFVADRRPALRLRWAMRFFMAGIVLFSGSLYLYSFLHFRPLVYVAPVGGTSLMLGWMALAWAGMRGED